MWGVVVGHYSFDVLVKEDHFNIEEYKHNGFACAEMEMFVRLIKWFSFEGQFVLHADTADTQGTIYIVHVLVDIICTQ